MSEMIVFPGQGSQSVGMGKDLYDNFSVAKEVFEEVDDAINFSLSRVIFEGPEADLTMTENTQPALMAVSMAVVRVLETQGNIKISEKFSYAAGHSLGEYSALCAAGVFSLSDTAKLLKIRGSSMQKAVPAGQGAMAAILNLSFEQVTDIAQKAAADTNAFCDIANDNSDGQIVISGHRQAIEKACEFAKEAGAKRALILPVSAPFHSRLMAPAADAMQVALSDVKMNEASLPIITNVSVQPTTNPTEIKDALVAQVTGRVRWRETMAFAADNNINTVVEAGAGKVLTGLFKRALKGASLATLNTPADIEAYLTA